MQLLARSGALVLLPGDAVNEGAGDSSKSPKVSSEEHPEGASTPGSPSHGEAPAGHARDGGEQQQPPPAASHSSHQSTTKQDVHISDDVLVLREPSLLLSQGEATHCDHRARLWGGLGLRWWSHAGSRGRGRGGSPTGLESSVQGVTSAPRLAPWQMLAPMEGVAQVCSSLGVMRDHAPLVFLLLSECVGTVVIGERKAITNSASGRF